MSVSKYVDWMELWFEEVCLDNSCLDELRSKAKENLEMFKQDTDVELVNDECDIVESGYLIYFGETGGQNESDNQGWSRDYCFHLDFDFIIQDVTYEQG
tara:strand:- start:1574 stop:1870 length:297 start_codon:yes stop_codon:yes gene_type:complete